MTESKFLSLRPSSFTSDFLSVVFGILSFLGIIYFINNNHYFGTWGPTLSLVFGSCIGLIVWSIIRCVSKNSISSTEDKLATQPRSLTSLIGLPVFSVVIAFACLLILFFGASVLIGGANAPLGAGVFMLLSIPIFLVISIAVGIIVYKFLLKHWK